MISLCARDAGEGGGARQSSGSAEHAGQSVRRPVEHTEQQKHERRGPARACSREPDTERGGAQEAAGGDPQQREGLRELLLLSSAGLGSGILFHLELTAASFFLIFP